MRSLSAALAWLTDACNQAGLSPQDGLRAQLLIEELFSNSVLHGYANSDSEEAHIWLQLAGNGADVTLTYQDAAPAYNPLLINHDDIAEYVLARQVGGVGRLLISELVCQASYQRQADRNVLSFGFAAEN